MRTFLFSLASLFVLCSAYASDIPRHLADVRILQENVQPQDNSYRHSDSDVRWKGYDGATKYVSHTDCSGLIDALMHHSYHIKREEMRIWLGKPHAKAKNYFRVIGEQKGFAHIHNINEVRPGDFVAMKFLPWAGDRGHDTGHIMIINELPKEVGPRNLKGENLIEWAVEVIDSSHGHGKTDTRFRNGKFHPGIGKGHAALYTNREGIVVGYSWTPKENSVFHDSSDRPLVIGRLISIEK